MNNDPNRLIFPLTDEEYRQNYLSLPKHPGNRFRLMFGLPLLYDENDPQTFHLKPIMLSTTLLGPYDDSPTTEKNLVSASIPPDVKERLFFDFLPLRGAIDKVICRQLYVIDAFLCKHPQLHDLDVTEREVFMNKLLNSIAEHLDKVEPEKL